MSNEQNIDLGYLECMGDEFHKAAKILAREWAIWKSGPSTENEDIEPAKEQVMYFLSQMLK